MNSVGQKIYQKFGWEAVGLFESQGEIDRSPIQFSEGNHSRLRPGDIKYRDLNGDGVIDDYDKMPVGFCDIPEITYGFGGAIELSLIHIFCIRIIYSKSLIGTNP